MDEFLAANHRLNPKKRRSREKIVVSATDPDAALGLDKQRVFRPLYNIQLIRDLDSPLTLAYGVFPQNTDGGMLGPMLQRTRDDLDLSLKLLLCDATYITGCNLAISRQHHVTLYGLWQENDYSSTKKKHRDKEPLLRKMQFTWLPEAQEYQCPEGHRLKWIGKEQRRQADGEVNIMHRYRCSPRDCQSCQRHASCTTNPQRGRAVKRSEHEDIIEAHKALMATDAAKAVYRLRKQTVELAYADLKENRGLRSFSGGGANRVPTEVGLLELVHNLLIVHRESNETHNAGTPSKSGDENTSSS